MVLWGGIIPTPLLAGTDRQTVKKKQPQHQSQSGLRRLFAVSDDIGDHTNVDFAPAFGTSKNLSDHLNFPSEFEVTSLLLYLVYLMITFRGGVIPV